MSSWPYSPLRADRVDRHHEAKRDALALVEYGVGWGQKQQKLMRAEQHSYLARLDPADVTDAKNATLGRNGEGLDGALGFVARSSVFLAKLSRRLHPDYVQCN